VDYFTGESFFISTLLKLAEVQNDDLAVSTVSPLRQILLLAILYLPAGLFAFAIWQGMSVTRQVRQKQILSGPWRIAFATLHGDAKPWDRAAGLSLFDPSHDRAGDITTRSPFAWGFCSVINRRFAAGNVSPLVEGIKAEEENKEFI
jgi:hypothetical protein